MRFSVKKAAISLFLITESVIISQNMGTENNRQNNKAL